MKLADPSSGGGLVDVFRHRYLLKLLVRKEVHVRYQGTVLGMAWSYAKPIVRFTVYWVVIGMILGMSRSIPNYAVHIVAGMTMVHFFNEVFNSGTASVVRNKSLVRRIYLPRELFPVASLLVSAVNALPAVVVLAIAAVATGWSPTWETIPALALAFALVGVFGMALGMLFSGFNVYFRDFAKVVDVITVFTPWSVPMIYSFHQILTQTQNHAWALEAYLANPVAIAAMLVQRGFWIPTVEGKEGVNDQVLALAPHLYTRGLVLLLISLLLLAFAQWVFKRLEGNFAEQL